MGPLDFHDFFLEFPGVSKVVRGGRQVQPSLKRKIPMKPMGRMSFFFWGGERVGFFL